MRTIISEEDVQKKIQTLLASGMYNSLYEISKIIGCSYSTAQSWAKARTCVCNKEYANKIERAVELVAAGQKLPLSEKAKLASTPIVDIMLGATFRVIADDVQIEGYKKAALIIAIREAVNDAIKGLSPAARQRKKL